MSLPDAAVLPDVYRDNEGREAARRLILSPGSKGEKEEERGTWWRTKERKRRRLR